MSYQDIWDRYTEEIEDWQQFSSPTPGLDAPDVSDVSKASLLTGGLDHGGELTISSGVVTVTSIWHTIDTEGDAASDYLRGIAGGTEGRLALISPENDGRTIIVDHNAASEASASEKIFLVDDTDLSLDDLDDCLLLLWRGDLDSGNGGWMEVARSPLISIVPNHHHPGDAGDGAQLAGASALSDVNSASGICGLDANGRVDPTQTAERNKGFVIYSPAAGNEVGIYFDKAITITQVNDAITGGTNAVWNIKHASTRDAASPNDLFSSDRTTSSTSGAETSSFNDATIPAGSWVWLSVTSVSGSVDALDVTIHFTMD